MDDGPGHRAGVAGARIQRLTVTTPTYATKTGRITSVSTLPVGGTVSIESFQYDLDGKTTQHVAQTTGAGHWPQW